MEEPARGAGPRARTLAPGDCVRVFCRTLGTWADAEVTSVEEDGFVRVEYGYEGYVCGKSIHMDSEHLVIPPVNTSSSDEEHDPGMMGIRDEASGFAYAWEMSRREKEKIRAKFTKKFSNICGVYQYCTESSIYTWRDLQDRLQARDFGELEHFVKRLKLEASEVWNFRLHFHAALALRELNDQITKQLNQQLFEFGILTPEVKKDRNFEVDFIVRAMNKHQTDIEVQTAGVHALNQLSRRPDWQQSLKNRFLRSLRGEKALANAERRGNYQNLRGAIRDFRDRALDHDIQGSAQTSAQPSVQTSAQTSLHVPIPQAFQRLEKVIPKAFISKT